MGSDTETHKPRWEAPEGATVRQYTPKVRKAVLAGWMPIDIDPIDRFVPDFFKGQNNPPTFLILKPSEIDGLRELQNNPDYSRAVADQVKAEGEILASDKAKVEFESLRNYAKSIENSCKTYCIGWENWRDGNGVEIPFVADKNGKMNDETIRLFFRSSAAALAIHARVRALSTLSGLEVEGFESSPISGMG